MATTTTELASRFWKACGSVEWAIARIGDEDDKDEEDGEAEPSNADGKLEVPRLHADALEPASFVMRFARPRRPVVLRGIVEQWPAWGKWSTRFFADELGNIVVPVDLGGGPQQQRFRKMPLREYFGLLSSGSPCSRHVPYVRLWRFEESCPALARDFAVPRQYVDDHFERLPRHLRPSQAPCWLFIGPPGAATPLHLDPWATHAWFAQLQGRKRFVLFPPADAQHVWDARSGAFADPLGEVNAAVFPRYGEARRVDVTLEPGDFLYLPPGWAHAVDTLEGEVSISLTANFLDRRSHQAIVAAYILFNMMPTSKGAPVE